MCDQSDLPPLRDISIEIVGPDNADAPAVPDNAASRAIPNNAASLTVPNNGVPFDRE